jgi:hypothetical protein
VKARCGKRFDLTVYPERDGQRKFDQILACVGCQKERAVLEPGCEDVPYSAYLIQAAGEDDREMSWDGQDADPPRQRRRIQSPRSPADTLPRWLALTEVEMQQKAMAALHDAGMNDGFIVRSRRNNLVLFDTRTSRQCLHHDAVHTSNSFSVEFSRDGCMYYHCTADGCRREDPPEIGRWRVVDNAVPRSLSELTDAESREWSAPLVARLQKLVELDKPSAKAKLEDCPRFPEFCAFVRKYTDKFFAMVLSSKVEIIQLAFDADDRVASYVCRDLTNSKNVSSSVEMGSFRAASSSTR